jgi:hypothetical protein
MKIFISIILLLITTPSYAYDASAIKLDAAKDRGCSPKEPCSIYIQEKDGILHVVATKALEIKSDGILRYPPSSKVIYKYNKQGEKIGIIKGR